MLRRSSRYAVTHVRNKICNIQGRSHNLVKVIFHTIRNSLKEEEEVPFLKRDPIEENRCLIRWSLFDVRNECMLYRDSFLKEL